jgi:alkylation response protein AidB-like acyl-CoA dehydrogenase
MPLNPPIFLRKQRGFRARHRRHERVQSEAFSSEAAVEITNLAIQVLGGHGYSRDYVVERLFRDARGLTLHFKTSEWLRQDIGKAALGL